jgi:hypothetical protein
MQHVSTSSESSVQTNNSTVSPFKVFTKKPGASPADIVLKRPKGKLVTAEEIHELREWTRLRYAADIANWEERDSSKGDRDMIMKENLKSADARLKKIKAVINNMDDRSFFENDEQYELFKEIKMRIFLPGKREWATHPPWS